MPAAEDFLKRCLEIREKTPGPDHDDTITTVSNLAWVYQNQKKYAEELPLLERERVAWERSKGPDSPEVGAADYNLGFVSGKLKKNADIERYYTAALAIREQQSGQQSASYAEGLVKLGDLALRLSGVTS